MCQSTIWNTGSITMLRNEQLVQYTFGIVMQQEVVHISPMSNSPIFLFLFFFSCMRTNMTVNIVYLVFNFLVSASLIWITIFSFSHQIENILSLVLASQQTDLGPRLGKCDIVHWANIGPPAYINLKMDLANTGPTNIHKHNYPKWTFGTWALVQFLI